MSAHTYPGPVGWVRPDHESLGGDWPDVVARLRLTPALPGVATFTARGRGDCMAPLLDAERDAVEYRRLGDGEPLQDGGLYVVKWGVAADVAAYARKIRARPEDCGYLLKVLRWFGGEWWCQCADSVARLDGEVVGVATAIVPADPLATWNELLAVANNIAPGAVIESYNSNVSSSYTVLFTSPVSYAANFVTTPAPALATVPNTPLRFTSPIDTDVDIRAVGTVMLQAASSLQIPSAIGVVNIWDRTSSSNLDYFPKVGVGHGVSNLGNGPPFASPPQTYAFGGKVRCQSGHVYEIALLCQTNASSMNATFSEIGLFATLYKR